MVIMLKITIKAMMMEVTIAEMTNYKEKEYFGRFMPGGVYLKIEKRYKKCFLLCQIYSIPFIIIIIIIVYS